MAVRHGSVGEFDHTVEDWETYVERVEIYLTANDIDNAARKRAILLSVCGPTTYRKIRDLASPKKPTEISYDDIVKIVQSHYDPKRGVAVQRFKFNSRVRQSGETVADYVAALKHLAIHCEYGDALDDMLRDRVTCGINDVAIQRRLLSEPDMDFTKAMKIAQSMEMAKEDALHLQGQPDKAAPLKPEEEVHKTSGGENKRTSPRGNQNCYRCGVRHRGVCRHKDTVCHNCGKKGHLARVCRSKKKEKEKGKEQKEKSPSPHDNQKVTSEETQKPPSTQTMTETESTEEAMNAEGTTEQAVEGEYAMFPLRKERYDPIQVALSIDNSTLKMEIDTGASLTVISEATYRATFGDQAPQPREANVKLKMYTGDEIPVVGRVDVNVQHNGQRKRLPLIITRGEGPSLLGRNWLGELRIDWRGIYKVQETDALSAVLSKHEAVFRDELGTITCAKASLHIDPQVPPEFIPPRPVPFSMRKRVDEELERLEKQGIIRPRQFAEWAAPIVAVPKADGSVRICGDYKVTVNKAMVCDVHPIPRSEDLFAAMSGGISFTKLDLSHAYLQLQLDDKARDYLVINTQKGLYEYTRMPFGITSAPAIFQRTMDNLLQGLRHVVVYIDDILITGESDEEHLATLDEVLSRLEKAGVRLKRKKCVFMAPEVDYLGHRINRDGLHPMDDRVQAITNMPPPVNVSKLRAFLGMINFYGKFLPNLSTVLAPLYKLLRKGVQWKWREKEQEAFEAAKALLMSPNLLVHYDVNKGLVLTCDASEYGLGAVLAHKMEDGSERPIRYASRTLTPAERNYAQIDKEALAIVYGVKHFHRYLFGRKFLICSDHKPLMYLLGEHRGISPTSSARVQRWALTLSGYQYTIVHRPGAQIGNADGLSRLPQPTHDISTPPLLETVLLMERLNSSLVTASHIREWTSRDPELSKFLKYALQGWPASIDPNCSYSKRKDEITVEDGCLLWGTRVIVPPQLRSKVVDEIHEGHPGINRMKSFARSYVWWPGLDRDLEKKVQQCILCQRNRKNPPKVPMHPWEWPEQPWTRLHVDHAGPVEGKILFLIVDAHSKWIDVHIVPSTSATSAINKLRLTFATHGLPRTIVSDNGTAFTSSEFQEFLRQNGIEHVRSAPYHPSSNGLAERAVQTVKEGGKKMKGPLELKLSRFLFKYRVTPQTTTGVAPAKLLMGRRLRTHLDLLYPSVRDRVRQRQRAQESRTGGKERQFKPQDRVMCRNFADGPKWLPGVVTENDSATSVMVKLDDGRVWRRHTDHVTPSVISSEDLTALPSVPLGLDTATPADPDPRTADHDSGTPDSDTFGEAPVQTEPVEPRRSTRTTKPPDRYGMEIPSS